MDNEKKVFFVSFMTKKLTQEYKNKITFICIILIFIYFFIFIPNMILEKFFEIFNNVFTFLLKLGLSILFIAILRWYIFSSDILQYGANKEANFFQNQFPSKYIRRKLNCSINQATDLWFNEIFNKWTNPKNPNYEQTIRTYERGYACRFIYYSMYWLFRLFIIASITYLIILFVPFFSGSKYSYNETDIIRFFILIGIIIGWILIYNSHKLDLKNNIISGCWKRWEEINGIHKSWLERHILRKAKNINEAFNIAKNIKY